MKSFLTLVLFGALTLSAAPVAIQGSGALGSFTGIINYVGGLPNAGLLTVTLTNTSQAANGGYITAFALNNPSNYINSATLVSGNGINDVLPFSLLNPISLNVNGGVSTSPYAAFDFGAGVGGSWLGGGSPNDGVAVGQTSSWAFVFTGTNLHTLSSQSFINALNEPGGEFVAVRFRGFRNGGSDKVVGDLTAVPEPGQYAFMLFAGVGAVIAMRKRRALQ